ncbi:nitrate ABC transporter permease [Streptomyces lunaelactis]|uniref:nitrate ABC transporter permease n=1 Tax=Streptomyces lunaelactis TaxID=1535768 RepID=UPI001585923A|nr:nitrate ABC transporter permease [Streptomyces lunaelactis]NUK01553.1 nitrate ABC transporter permease [Streptomyces lunaelactis]NUK08726.1 nitrate ABC transporter permease [Streptomyces lunaelactis]NUK13868.1 nitrate ABC transporter permease [Streptomyces lunaelactis]NUK23720.1 nitrate ABC transporter permease [Streptomyces lunaelactis]NUK32799.1 nitrate ABC transporter permease [Streptomyces lunaelactis]
MTSSPTHTDQAEPAVADAQPGRPGPPAAPGSPTSGGWGSRLAELGRGIGWAVLGTAIIVLLWQLAAFRSTDVPAPLDGARTLIDLMADPFYDNGPNDKGVGLQLATSLQRVFTGFALAAVVGVLAGLFIGASRRAWLAFNPVVQVLRPVSPLAWFPIWLAVFKDASQASIFVIFITALWPTLINTAAGAAEIPQDHRNVARVFRFGHIAYLRHVLIPNALPSIITGLRLSMGIAWMVIVAVEMLSGNSGIGFFVWDSYNAGNLSSVVAAIVLIGLVGLILDAILVRLSRKVAIEEVQS